MQYNVKAILFDLDGTLVDSTVVVERQWGLWAARHGVPLAEILKVSHGVRSADTMRRFRPDLDVEAEAAAHERAEELDTDGVVEVAGAGALLRALPAGAWTIVTSCPRGLALARLRVAGLPIPESMVVAEDVSHGKPHPEGYLLGAERLGVAPEECLVFEDAPAGLAAGRAAGMRVVGVTTTYDAARLAVEAAVADYRGLRVRPGLVVELG